MFDVPSWDSSWSEIEELVTITPGVHHLKQLFAEGPFGRIRGMPLVSLSGVDPVPSLQ